MESVKCNLCHGSAVRLLFSGGDISYDNPEIFNIVRCRRCGLVYLNPRPTVKEIGRYYPDEYYPMFQPGSRKGIVDKIRRILMKTYFGYGKSTLSDRIVLFPFYLVRSLFVTKGVALPFVKGGRFLEIGFGDGSLMYEYKSYGWDVYGTDISDYAVKNARLLGMKVYKGQLEKLKFKGDFFDAVYMSHVMEHLHDPYKVLLEMRRILKKGGVAAIVLPNFDSIEQKILGGKWVVGLQIPRHLYHFSPKTLKSLALKAGFSGVEVLYIPQQTTLIGSLQYLLKRNRISINLFSKFFLVLMLPLMLLMSIFRTSGIFAVYLRK